MPDNTHDRSSLVDGLDRAREVVSTLGLVLSGAVCAAGMAGFLFVLNRVMQTTPLSFGSQGEWLYAAIACLLVAGWGFAQAVKFYSRRRSAEAPRATLPMPTFTAKPGGVSVEINSSRPQNSDDVKPSTWTWSIQSDPAPIKSIELTEAQLAAAELVAQPGDEWDTVARQVNPDYGTWSAFEQSLYRHALQTSLENRRRNR